MEKTASSFEVDKAVFYIPSHVRLNHNGDKRHKDVEKGVVVGNNDAAGLVFVRFGSDPTIKACYPRDLEYDTPASEVKNAPTPPAVGTASVDSKAQGAVSGGTPVNLDKGHLSTP